MMGTTSRLRDATSSGLPRPRGRRCARWVDAVTISLARVHELACLDFPLAYRESAKLIFARLASTIPRQRGHQMEFGWNLVISQVESAERFEFGDQRGLPAVFHERHGPLAPM